MIWNESSNKEKSNMQIWPNVNIIRICPLAHLAQLRCHWLWSIRNVVGSIFGFVY